MSLLIDLIGAAGSILFATACVPVAWATWRLGRSVGTPVSTVWTFVLATLLFTIYLAAKVGVTQIPTVLLFIEFVCWGVALKFHYFPRTTP